MNQRVSIVDKPYTSFNGYLMFVLGLLLTLAPLWVFLFTPDFRALFRFNLGNTITFTGIAISLGIFILCGLYTVQPNQAVVVLLFGAYQGTDRAPGLRWVFPFLSRKQVSERVNNFITQQMKVNDKNGNPIEIAAAVAWRVSDAAQATLGIEDYAQYVKVQSESAVRHMASEFAYDHGADDDSTEAITLRSGGETITQILKKELTERLAAAGLIVLETRITHLAYAPEIASAMLRRQQANAVLSARKIIVEGAVGMVEMALSRLEETQMVELDNERKAAMVSNLLVVLCSERDVTPVINSGTLYQ